MAGESGYFCCYVNDTPLSSDFRGGGPGSVTCASQIVPAGVVRPGTNTLYFYQREIGGLVSGLLFSGEVRIGPEKPELEPHGCGVNPPGSLTILAGTPAIGTTMTFGVDNPEGTQAPGSLTRLGISGPDPNFPCGTPLPGFGMVAPAYLGELLIKLPPIQRYGGPAWTGPGIPTPIDVPIPNHKSLVGLEIFAQGALLDFTPGAIPAIAFTEGMRLLIGY